MEGNSVCTKLNIKIININLLGVPQASRWPSGLRRYVKAVVFTGVGSNPTRVIVIFCHHIDPTAISFYPALLGAVILALQT